MSNRHLAAAVVVAALVLTGCGPASAPDSSPSDAPAAASYLPAPEPGAVANCMQQGDAVLSLDASALPSEALAFGDGDSAVILAHQAGQAPCAWEPYGRELAARGYRVFIPSLLGAPDVIMGAAVRWLSENGVDGYAMVGASMGAAISLATAGELEPAPTVVVALSSPTEYNDVDALGAIGSVTGPVLLIAGDADDDFAEQARRLAAAQPHAELLVVSSPAHGIQLRVDSAEAAQRLDEALDAALG